MKQVITHNREKQGNKQQDETGYNTQLKVKRGLSAQQKVKQVRVNTSQKVQQVTTNDREKIFTPPARMQNGLQHKTESKVDKNKGKQVETLRRVKQINYNTLNRVKRRQNTLSRAKQDKRH